MGDDGKFYKNYMHFMTPYFKGSLDISEISTEFDEQIRRVKVAGLNVTHLDSHEHIHMFPGVFGVTLDLAKKYGIKYIRIPEESMKSMGKDFSVKDMLRQIGLRMFTARKKKEIVKNGLVCNDRFLGHFHSGRIDDDILCYLLGRIDAGITELAIHPADADDEFIEKFPWYKNTRTELSMLLEGSWRKKAKMLGIEIITQA